MAKSNLRWDFQREGLEKGPERPFPAEFMMDRNGASYLEQRMSAVLSRQVMLEQATPEYLARFDSYPGNPSNLDLGIIGYLKRASLKEGLFVGVEAKVDETFGGTVRSRYSWAMKTREVGKNTNAPERVKGLLSNYFSVEDSPACSRFADIRYQLLTGTAGTVATPYDVCVFYIMVFRTSLYDERKGFKNRQDYENFVAATHGKFLMQDGRSFRSDELQLGGKRLVCVYDALDF